MFIRFDTYEIEQSLSTNCFEVDDLIAPAISSLNRKGYKTAFSCSGHPDTGHDPEIAYIAFTFGGITPEYLPAGWNWVFDGQMEYRYHTATASTIKLVMSRLTAWAETLPDVSS